MKDRWNRFLSLLLAVCTVFAMIPAAFAAEAEPAEEPVAEAVAEESAEAPAEEPAAEAADPSAPEALPAAEAELPGITAAAAVVPDGSSEAEYATLTISGTRNDDLAAEFWELINQERMDGDAATPLMRTEAASAAALAMAAESVISSQPLRANGEGWLTLAGDFEVAINEGTTPHFCFAVTEEADAEEALAQMSGANSAILESTSFNNMGVACFQLKDGSYYWAAMFYSGTAYQSAGPEGTGAYSREVPFTGENAMFDIETELLPGTELDQGSTVSVGATLFNGFDQIPLAQGDLIYQSSNKQVLTVNTSGVISVVGAGNATITVTLAASDAFAVSLSLSAKLNPIAPTVTSVSNGHSGVVIKWQKVPGASNYYVYRSTRNNAWTINDRIAIANANATSYTDAAAAAGTVYYYTVASVYTTSGTPVTRMNSDGVALRRLPTPTHKSAEASSHGITFTWKDITGEKGYTVWRKSGSSGYTKIATVGANVTSYVDTSVKKNTTYEYTVRAYNGSYLSDYLRNGKTAKATHNVTTSIYTVKADVYYRIAAGTDKKSAGTLKKGTQINVISGWSTKANDRTWYKFIYNNNVYYVVSDHLLATPKFKSVTSAADGIQLTWNKIANATGYAIYRKAPGETGWKRIKTITSGTTTSYIDPASGLTSGAKYFYTIRATYGSVLSAYDNTGSSTTFIAAPALVSAKANLNTGKITFTWKPVEGATGYTVWRKVDGSGWTKVQTITDPDTNSYVDSDILRMSEYTYTVRAQTSSGQSHYNTTGLTEILIPDGTLASLAVKEEVKYRKGPGTNYGTAGTLKKGAATTVVTDDIKSTWCRILVTDKSGSHWYYIPSSSLLQNPKMKSTAISLNGIEVSWEKINGATNYELWRKTGSGSWKRIVDIPSANTTKYLDTSVNSGTKYTYTLRATVNGVRSSYDSVGISTVFLATPSLISIKSDKTGINITWGPVEGANGFRIFRRSLVNGQYSGWERVKVIDRGTTLSFKDTEDLFEGVTYEYTVRAAYSNSIISYYNSPGLRATAQKTLNPDTVKYKLLAQASYYKLVNGGIYYSGLKGTLKKGATINVLEGMTIVMDEGTSREVEYTAFLDDGKFYYVRSSLIEKVD